MNQNESNIDVMVSVKIPFIPENIREEVQQAERKKVQELKEEGKVKQLFIGNTMKNAWMMFTVDNFEEVNEILESLPIFQYLYIDDIIPVRQIV